MAQETTLTWSIDSAQHLVSNGLITNSKCHVTGVTSETSGDGIYNELATYDYQVPPVDFGTVVPDPMIPYADVTEANVISWIKAGIGTAEVTNIETYVKTKLDKLVNPPSPTQTDGLPWQ